MKYLLDTCVISELVKKAPAPAVLRWVENQDEENLYLSVLTLGELQRGVSKLLDRSRAEQLQAWLNDDLTHRFQRRILPVDQKVAKAWGEISGDAARRGETLPVMDSLIAATAQVHGLVVVTRNVRDIERCRVPVTNPWPDTRADL
ncbi:MULTISPECIES: type II toxin-antitoxin system VapC family toxin [Kyrpidia]|uniref:Ribonuclease VapC n=2 Tax=Kyrpidia TaxID=1129704 RepID=A0A6F9EII2_9BACL|nr:MULTISPECIES: type II toxin-antitoxin system VapC family toxin [Kyrpidia]ADG07803.1 PilT protein domain protein [Kyrpidia tusciae DSM 2912]CAB3396217.1 Ribonuclease VapC [Kyrpidia spormannii]HHY67203.1 type II toxin-antitoxin system VapC family toxin [Alicyclobacillus sp.]